MNQVIQSLMLSIALAYLVGCGGGQGIKRSDELDSDTAAEVRRINLEKYAGDWLIRGTKGEIYISIDETGYYWTQEDTNETLLGADFGRIDHRAPGKMVLYSERPECETSRLGSWLWMDRAGHQVRLRSSEDKNFAVSMLLVDKLERERERSLPCGILAN